MKKSLCSRLVVFFLLGGISLTLLLYGGRYRILSWYGSWLIGEVDSSLSWEALFVLSGRPFERGIAASTFWASHPTPVYVTGGLSNDNLLAAGHPIHTECALSREVLLNHCVPDSLIHLMCEGTSTYEEIRLIEHFCLSRGYRRIGIVSSVFHGRRIQLLARRYLTPSGVQVQFLPAKPLLFHPEAWWRNEHGFLTALEETIKLLFYRLKGIL